jgi:hypothetical protein
MNVVLLLLILAAVVVLVVLARRLANSRRQYDQIASDLQDERDKYSLERTRWAAQAYDHATEIQRLSKWTVVADADDKAKEILQAAQAVLDKANADALAATQRANSEATTLLESARTEASALVADTRQETKTLKERAAALLDSSTTQAKKIIEEANLRAQEIAGSAYGAMKNADLYEQTVKAMKNIIEGYGDQYLVPEHSLLDDLAEEFGYTEAGAELKKAREQSKAMINNGTAATCEYVEPNRRTTAIAFVIDAFNGKVDSILSRVKHDNAGTLEQEVRDAFTLVNYNGKAFRDARITEEFLTARLAELKWAAVAQQLKLQEREEQRRIKEQIREEEKARREFERAIREAAKEEELLKKAMEKAQQQLAAASEEQKAKYEDHIVKLNEKLKEAEERNQRAISMAQQTKRGHVYIISNVGSFGESVYKIGLTRRLEPLDRVRELGDSSVPFEFDVHAMIFSEDAPALETQLHKHFVFMQMNKVNYRKEFFRVDLQHVREEVGKFGIEAKWTMAAEAREYRETLAIERAIEDNPPKREAWVKRQLELERVENAIPALVAVEADEKE